MLSINSERVYTFEMQAHAAAVKEIHQNIRRGAVIESPAYVLDNHRNTLAVTCLVLGILSPGPFDDVVEQIGLPP